MVGRVRDGLDTINVWRIGRTTNNNLHEIINDKKGKDSFGSLSIEECEIVLDLLNNHQELFKSFDYSEKPSEIEHEFLFSFLRKYFSKSDSKIKDAITVLQNYHPIENFEWKEENGIENIIEKIKSKKYTGQLILENLQCCNFTDFNYVNNVDFNNPDKYNERKNREFILSNVGTLNALKSGNPVFARKTIKNGNQLNYSFYIIKSHEELVNLFKDFKFSKKFKEEFVSGKMYSIYNKGEVGEYPTY